MSQQRVMKLAARGKRFTAGLIDCAPAAVVIVLLFGVLLKNAVALIQSLLLSMNSGDYSVYDGSPYVRNSGLSVTPFLIVLILYWLLQLYFMSRSQSIGKALFHMRVVDAHTGRPIGFAKMLLREIIVKKASRILFLGYIWILIDKYNRSWHDKILDTYVIDEGPKQFHQAHTGEPVGETIFAEDDWNARREAEENAREEIMKNLYTSPSGVESHSSQEAATETTVNADIDLNPETDMVVKPEVIVENSDAEPEASQPKESVFEPEEDESETADESPVIILPGQVVQGPFEEDSEDSAADPVSEKNNEE